MIELAARWSFAAAVDVCSHSVRTSKKPVTSSTICRASPRLMSCRMRGRQKRMVRSIRVSFEGNRPLPGEGFWGTPPSIV